MGHICIFHMIDLDGWTSAAIVKQLFPDTILIGYNYGQPVPTIPHDYDVVICDVAFPMEVMSEMAVVSTSFTWIDHHISNIIKYNKYRELTDVNYWSVELPKEGELIGACELAWRHYHPTEPTPEAIRLLGMYDCFRHKGTTEEDTAMFFQLAAQSVANEPVSAMPFLGMNIPHILDMVEDGRTIYRYKAMGAKQSYAKGFPVVIHGKRFHMSNSDRFNPTNYGINYHDDGYDGSGSFWFDGKIWHMSLYTDNPNLDCSVICKFFGGGGHKGASGCEPSIATLLDIMANKYAAEPTEN
jgi:hypothetical protein